MENLLFYAAYGLIKIWKANKKCAPEKARISKASGNVLFFYYIRSLFFALVLCAGELLCAPAHEFIPRRGISLREKRRGRAGEMRGKKSEILISC